MVAPSPTTLLPPAPSSTAAAATSLADAASATLASAAILLSLASVSFILHFHLRASSHTGPRPPRRLRDLNSLWAVRVLFAAFACLWSLAELLRLPLVHGALLVISPPPQRPRLQLELCRVYVVFSQGFAEPCFFATLLFLLRASLQGKTGYPNAFAAALSLALLSSLPFLVCHALFLSFGPWVLARLRIPAGVFFGGGSTSFANGDRCSYPLFSTALLGGFGSVYVPWFVSACWQAVAVAINKRLCLRLYALTATVVVGISVQVTALALSAFWNPGDPAFEGLSFAAFLGIFFSAVVGVGVLVIRPIADALDAVTCRIVPAADSHRKGGGDEGSSGAGPVAV